MRTFKATGSRKLLLSLGINFGTRIPGVLSSLLVLPLIRFDLGTLEFATLLSTIALGNMAAVPFVGFGTMSRRSIGEARGAGDKDGEAIGFANLLTINSVVLVLSIAALALYSMTQPEGMMVFLISALIVLSCFANSVDHARAAFNEYYVTATLQIIFQITNCAILFLFKGISSNILIAAYVIQGHILLASIISAVILIIKRPYLISKKPQGLRWLIRNGIIVGFAEGILGAFFSISVLWVQNTSSPTTSGWYSTLQRLCLTIMAPATLLVMPMASFIRLDWHRYTFSRQRTILLCTMVLGLLYGAIASLCLFFASRLYVDKLLQLPGPTAWQIVVPIFGIFATVIAYRCYATVSYLVTDGGRLARDVSVGLVLSLVAMVFAGMWLDPLQTVAFGSVLISVVLLGSMATNFRSFSMFRNEQAI